MFSTQIRFFTEKSLKRVCRHWVSFIVVLYPHRNRQSNWKFLFIDSDKSHHLIFIRPIFSIKIFFFTSCYCHNEKMLTTKDLINFYANFAIIFFLSSCCCCWCLYLNSFFATIYCCLWTSNAIKNVSRSSIPSFFVLLLLHHLTLYCHVHLFNYECMFNYFQCFHSTLLFLMI